MTSTSSNVPLTELVTNIADVMETLRLENVALQDALSVLAEGRMREDIPLEELQSLDRHAQIHEDVARLMTAMAEAVGDRQMPETRILSALKLEAMRQQFLSPLVSGPATPSGDVSLF